MTEIIKYDYDIVTADGSDNLTQAIMKLLNEFPQLDGEIEFQTLDTTKGKAMFPNPSVAILTENESVTGHVRQMCAYAFTVVYRTRTTATNKEKIKEWLDNLGRWLEHTKYPALEGEKEFKKIERTSQSYLYGETTDKAQDWAISLQATYTNEFDR